MQALKHVSARVKAFANYECFLISVNRLLTILAYENYLVKKDVNYISHDYKINYNYWF